MAHFIILLFAFIFTLSVYFFDGRRYLLNLSNLEKSPNGCCGENLCKYFKNGQISLKFDSITTIFNNLLSVKDVFYAVFNDTDIVLKKWNLKNDFIVEDNNDVSVSKSLLKQDHFQICDKETAQLLFNVLAENLNTILKANPEPILFEIFKSLNYVPKVYGYCGHMVAMENCGIPLYKLVHTNWYERAFLAYQLLCLAEAFTFSHKHFKLYLTDISADNIVVNMTDLRIFMVDLDDVILQRRFLDESSNSDHYSEHFPEEDFAFSKNEVCKHKISDHNVYAVCKLILSKFAKQPLQGGLLHSPPADLEDHKLFESIEYCVYTTRKLSRFQYSTQIKIYLKEILVHRGYLFSS